MTTPSMPRGMRPLVAGYGFGAPGGAMATQVAGGSSRYGLEFDRGTQRLTVTLLLDRVQFSVWTAFHLQVIKKGTISFLMPLDTGFGDALHLVNIVPETYSVTRVDALTASVAFSVETESQAYLLDEDEAQSLVDMYEIYTSDLQPMFRRLAIFANSDTNVLDF
ncbi:hypothetical protein SNE35_28630 [Paucibacter sp. R3-3]|uniref:Uncharacterized protein n=1 Tax=Roseateles agri TaxID=3098619 RepID=A0ABU5DS81_9BURK|nr:hypothetical protein [Paucibacter sp. R3-3]MDY0748500.1 hypothetical protein [Paucibacter sp. R3-3]